MNKSGGFVLLDRRYGLLRRWALGAILLSAWPCWGHAEDFSKQLAAALAEPMLPPGLPLREMKAFIEPRIVALPQPKDLEEWQATAARLRRDVLEKIVFRGAAQRWRDAPCKVEWLDRVTGGPGYAIRKFRFEALPGMWIPGLLYEPEQLSGKVPLALHVNGHAPEGKAVSYKQLRGINLAKRGILVLDIEWFGMGQLRTAGFSHYRMNQLDLCGASGLAPFYLAMSRALDLGLALEHADPSRVVVSGLSGGGWQTILIGALDERVTLANPVAGYGSFRTNILYDDLGDSEQAPTDLGQLADYAHLTALRAPRPTLLTYNAADDCCFRSGHTLEPLLAAARPIFALYQAEGQLRSHVNHVPGTHNFEQDNREALYAMLGDTFFPGKQDFARGEIDSTAELKTAEQLHVPLPAGNLDFHTLALQLLKEIPAAKVEAADRASAEAWQRQARERLKALMRISSYEAKLGPIQEKRVGSYRATRLTWRLSDTWSVPAVAIESADRAPQRTVVLVADGGRASESAVAETARLVAAGARVVTVDALLWGESKMRAQDPEYLFPLFVAAVGERPLGLQAAQLTAIARACRARWPDQPLSAVALGPRASLAALVATAIEPEAMGDLEVTEALPTLRQAIEDDLTVETLPEHFAFGLLSEFDVCQMVALAAPRLVRFRQPTPRAQKELAPLAAWYRLFGVDFSPAP